MTHHRVRDFQNYTASQKEAHTHQSESLKVLRVRLTKFSILRKNKFLGAEDVILCCLAPAIAHLRRR
jgi:hypothetical protein